MKIAIFTQDERVYLPTAVGTVVEAMPERISCIVLSPPMSTHGGAVKGLLRHLPVFGVQGTLRMGADPASSVVAPHGETHDVKGLYVTDASLLPTSIIVNPQVTVYALASYISGEILARRG